MGWLGMGLFMGGLCGCMGVCGGISLKVCKLMKKVDVRVSSVCLPFLFPIIRYRAAFGGVERHNISVLVKYTLNNKFTIQFLNNQYAYPYSIYKE